MPLPCFRKLNNEGPGIICTDTGVLANFHRIYVNKPNVKYTWLYRFQLITFNIYCNDNMRSRVAVSAFRVSFVAVSAFRVSLLTLEMVKGT